MPIHAPQAPFQAPAWLQAPIPLVSYGPCSRVDTYIVFITSILIAVSAALPPILTVRYTYNLLSQLKSITKSRTKNDTPENDEIKQAKEKALKNWKKKACIFAASLLAYYYFINSRASNRYRRIFRNLPIWNSYYRYLSVRLLSSSSLPPPSSQKILAVIPHGLVPYSLGLSALNTTFETFLGPLRVVAAGATKFLPGLSMLIRGIDGCSASRDSVAEVLKQGGSPAVSPGGISEMFQGYPKKGFSPNQEVALLRNRKGFIKLSHIHNVPTIPVYVFGSSKLMRRLDVPGLEVLSRVLRASLCVIYGRLGLPVPFRVGLTYVVGKAIYPRGTVEETHERFCEELKRIFDEFKGDYGWDRKELVIV